MIPRVRRGPMWTNARADRSEFGKSRSAGGRTSRRVGWPDIQSRNPARLRNTSSASAAAINSRSKADETRAATKATQNVARRQTARCSLGDGSLAAEWDQGVPRCRCICFHHSELCMCNSECQHWFAWQHIAELAASTLPHLQCARCCAVTPLRTRVTRLRKSWCGCACCREVAED